MLFFTHLQGKHVLFHLFVSTHSVCLSAPHFMTAGSSQQSWLLGLKMLLGLKRIHLPVSENQEEGTCCTLVSQHPAYPWHHLVYSPSRMHRLRTISVCFIPLNLVLRPHRWQAWMQDPCAYHQPCSRQSFPGKLKNTFHPAQITGILATESGYSITSR